MEKGIFRPYSLIQTVNFGETRKHDRNYRLLMGMQAQFKDDDCEWVIYINIPP